MNDTLNHTKNEEIINYMETSNIDIKNSERIKNAIIEAEQIIEDSKNINIRRTKMLKIDMFTSIVWLCVAITILTYLITTLYF